MTLLLFKKEITKRENSSTSVADRFNKWPFPIPTSGKWGLLGMSYQDHRGRPQRWPMAARRVYICPLSWEHLGVPQVIACFSGNLTNVVLVTVSRVPSTLSPLSHKTSTCRASQLIMFKCGKYFKFCVFWIKVIQFQAKKMTLHLTKSTIDQLMQVRIVL